MKELNKMHAGWATELNPETGKWDGYAYYEKIADGAESENSAMEKLLDYLVDGPRG